MNTQPLQQFIASATRNFINRRFSGDIGPDHPTLDAKTSLGFKLDARTERRPEPFMLRGQFEAARKLHRADSAFHDLIAVAVRALNFHRSSLSTLPALF